MTTVRRRILYFGIALSGKRTNLEVIKAGQESERKVEGSASPEQDAGVEVHMVRMDLGALPCELVAASMTSYDEDSRAELAQMQTHLLFGADAVVFVVDSQVERLDANIEAKHQLQAMIQSSETTSAVPVVVQLNKRDLENAADCELLWNELGAPGWLVVDAVADQSIGVWDTLETVASMLMPSPAEAEPAPVNSPQAPSASPEAPSLRVRMVALAWLVLVAGIVTWVYTLK